MLSLLPMSIPWQEMLAGAVVSAGALLVGWQLRTERRALRRRLAQDLRQPQLDDAIEYETLAKLARASPLVRVRNSVWAVMLDRLMQDDLLTYVLHLAEGDDREDRLQAVTLLRHVSLKPGNAKKLVKAGALKVLCKALLSADEQVIRMAALALEQVLRAGKDATCKRAAKCDIINVIRTLLERSTPRQLSLVRDVLDMLEPLVMCDYLTERIVEAGMLPLLARTGHKFIGNVFIQKLCMEFTVRLLSVSTESAVKNELKAMLNENIIVSIGHCIRSSNSELHFMTVGLIHEYAIHDLACNELCAVFGMALALMKFLESLDKENSGIIRIVLRIFKVLATKDEKLRHQLMDQNAMKHLVSTIRDQTPDVQLYALQTISVLLRDSAAVLPFLQAGGLSVLALIIPISTHPLDDILIKFFTDIISSEDVPPEYFDDDVVQALKFALFSEDSETQTEAALAIFTCSAMLEGALASMVSTDVIDRLAQLARSGESTGLRLTCAKILVAAASYHRKIANQIVLAAILPLMYAIVGSTASLIRKGPESAPSEQNTPIPISLSSPHKMVDSRTTISGRRYEFDEESFDEPLYEHPNPSPDLDCLFILTQDFSVLAGTLDDMIPEAFLDALWDLMAMPLAIPSPSDVRPYGALLERCKNVFGAQNSRISTILRHIRSSYCHEEIAVETRLHLFTYALNCLAGLWGYERVRKTFTERGLIEILFIYSCFDLDISNSCVIALSQFLGEIGTPWQREALSDFNQLDSVLTSKYIHHMWRCCTSDSGTKLLFANHLLSMLCNRSDDDDLMRPLSVQWNESDKTSRLWLSRDRCEVRNFAWSFESVRGTHGVAVSGKYMYEVLLLSAGIIQIGWATKSSVFDPFSGNGVGDDEHSFGYDGCRRRVWHKPSASEASYGPRWSTNDRIGVCIDLDAGNISYWYNGQPIGIAFANLDTNLVYYPALSLSSGEACRVSFNQIPGFEYKAIPQSLVPVGNIEAGDERTLTPVSPLSPDVTTVSPKSENVTGHACMTTALYYSVHFDTNLWKQTSPAVFGYMTVDGEHALLVELCRHQVGLLHVTQPIPRTPSKISFTETNSKLLNVIPLDRPLPSLNRFWCGIGFGLCGRLYLTIDGGVVLKELPIPLPMDFCTPLALNMPRIRMDFRQPLVCPEEGWAYKSSFRQAMDARLRNLSLGFALNGDEDEMESIESNDEQY